MSWVYRLHYTLLAGAIGKTVVGVGGLALMLLCLSGLGLGWPRSSGQWRRVMTVKRDGNLFRFCYDLHRVLGFFLVPLLVLVAFSGTALVFPQAVKTVVGAVLPVEDRPKPYSGPGTLRLSIDEAVAIGAQVFPDAQLKRVALPQGERGAFELAFRQPGEPWSNHAASVVWVDQYRGEVLAAWDALQLTAGSKFLSWQFPLHNGDLLGLPGRWLICLSGLGLVVLSVTGLDLYRHRCSRTPRFATRESNPRGIDRIRPVR